MEEIELNDRGRTAHEAKRNKRRRMRKLRGAKLSAPHPNPRRMTKKASVGSICSGAANGVPCRARFWSQPWCPPGAAAARYRARAGTSSIAPRRVSPIRNCRSGEAGKWCG